MVWRSLRWTCRAKRVGGLYGNIIRFVKVVKELVEGKQLGTCVSGVDGLKSKGTLLSCTATEGHIKPALCYTDATCLPSIATLIATPKLATHVVHQRRATTTIHDGSHRCQRARRRRTRVYATGEYLWIFCSIRANWRSCCWRSGITYQVGNAL